MHSFFRFPNFSETLKECPRNFSALWDRVFFWRKNVITRIMHKNFRYPKTFETLKGFPRKLSALWDKKFSREKRDTPIMRKISRYHNISETLQGCSRNLSALWDHVFSTEKWDTPPPFFIRKNFSKTEVFSKTLGFLYKKFQQCETNNFPRKIVTPLLCIFFLDTRIFLKHWRNVHENFRHCETENFWRKNVITRNMHNFFRYPKLFETLKGLPRKLLALWDKKVWRD